MGNVESKQIPYSATCVETLGISTDSLKVGGFCGFNFIIDNADRDVYQLYNMGRKLR